MRGNKSKGRKRKSDEIEERKKKNGYMKENEKREIEKE